MRKNSKKISLAILALTALSLGTVAAGNLSLRTAAGEIKALDTFRLENVSVRLKLPGENANGGFRFESLISQDAYNGLTNVIEVGTLFTITDMSEDSLVMGASNVAKIVLEGTVGGEKRRGGEKTTDDEGKDVISYRAFINDIPNAAFDTDVMARSYVIADGVTYYTNVVTQSVGDVARTAYYDVKNTADEVYCNEVTSGWYSPFVAAQREEISEYIKTTEKTYAPQYVLVEDGNATFDLTKLSVEANDVVGVMVDGAFTEWSVDGSTLAYATTVGEKTMTLATKDGVYDVALVQADNVITTWAEFKAWGTDANKLNAYEYTVLANDITYQDATAFEFPAINGNFKKTFDGLGHTIENLVATHGIVRRLVTGGVWKNVNYTNFKLSGDWGILGAGLSGGTFENVSITGSFGQIGNKWFLGRDNNQGDRVATTIKDCTFTLTDANNADRTLISTNSNHIRNNLDLINSTITYCSGGLSYDADKVTLTSSNIYDADDLATNYYAKVSDATATFPLSQMGENAPTTVSKLLVNGKEVQATVENGNLIYPATSTGTTTLMMTTNKGEKTMNIVHADNVISSWAEFSAWGGMPSGTTATNDNAMGEYEYTVLANDIIYEGTSAFEYIGNFNKTFDGLGHTIKNLITKHGIVRGLVTGAVWKNVNYTGFMQSDNSWGILSARLRGGTFENVNIEGVFNGGNYYLAASSQDGDATIKDCVFTITNSGNTSKNLVGVYSKAITLINTTINYSGTLNYNADKVALNNSKIKSNYAG